jgi:hypothetical protein
MEKTKLDELADSVYNSPKYHNVFLMARQRFPNVSNLDSSDANDAATMILDEMRPEVRKMGLSPEEDSYVQRVLSSKIWQGLM